MTKTKNSQLNSTALLFIVLSGALFWWAAYLKNRYGVVGAEISTFRTINNWPDWLRLIFTPLTELGSWIALGFLTIVAWSYKERLLAIRLFFYGLVGFLLSQALKFLIDKPRPAELLSNVHQRESFAFNSLGFPSSHTTMATILALLLWPVLPKQWRWLAPLWIITVAVSRIYLGAHTPLDVIGGFAVGVFVVCVGLVIEKFRKRA